MRVSICSRFRKELEAVLAGGDFPGIEGITYPALCAHPQRDLADKQQSVISGLDEEPTILILGGCFMANTKPVLHGDQSRIVHATHCLYLFAGETMIDSLLASGAFLMTPGWLQSWREMIGQWVFDQSSAQDFFRESATRIVLLDTGLDKQALTELKAFGDYIGLPAEALPVGLDHFRLVLKNEIAALEKTGIEKSLQTVKGKVNQQDAENLMMLDLLEGLVQKNSEAEVVSGLFDLLAMLFAASDMVYLPHDDGDESSAIYHGGESARALYPELRKWSDESGECCALSGDGTSFFIRIQHKDSPFGVLGVGGFSFPQYIKRYLARSKSVARLCGMIIENIRLLERVAKLANIDGLTGLLNRRSFVEKCQREIERSCRYDGSLSAIMFDLDFFKKVNDTWGHAAGDLVLKSVSDCARSQLRTTDICGRLGGEEFAMLLPETPIEGALEVAERFRVTLEGLPIFFGGQRISVTASIGLAEANRASVALVETFDTLLAKCDEALYAAKKNGRNRCEVYRPS